ncbi:MAG: universal stress protein UspA [Rhizobiales bacterium 12-68-15]|nr:MAG: universal stress protein UspA [Rhizobiales bacterium 12-68-15]
MIRDILVNLTQGKENDPAAAYAASLAAQFSAHLTGLAVTYEIDVPPFYMGALPTDFIETQMAENAAAAHRTIETFSASAEAAAIAYEVRQLNGSLGVAASTLAEMARTFDLTVVAQPDPDQPGPEEVIAETVLLESGRAVLIVPYVQRTPYRAGRAVVAWDGSRAAARALAEGLPLPGETSVAQTILNEVSDQGADLVVMGGYGHSRLRELVLGGVTREILGAMTVPVLMAH